ncbi:MAG: hypothetical protein IMZ50_13775 [Candidatus Atribacteria bacterium]|nr:hypothetical protein [Candidatus Atribacteria bacterium]
MLSTSDLLHLPYTPDLTEGGIAYACRSLTTTYGRMGGSQPRAPSGNRDYPAGTGTNVDRLRRTVAGVAAELAFRRTLSEQSIPFDVLGATPFTHPDRYDVSLGGHRCHLKSFLITRRQQIALIRQDPALVLQAPALVPLDQFAAEDHKPDDLYLFAFLLGVVAATREDVDRATAAGQPAYLIHPLPDEWARPANWLPLEKLALKSECEAPISVEIGGQNTGREFVTATLELPPKKRVPVEQSFYSLAYVHAARRPGARIGLHSPLRGEAYIVPAHAWGNIWVYGMDILLTGWLTHEEYRRRSSVLPIGSRTFQYDQTRTKNLSVPVIELKPLGGLLAHVKEWEAERGRPAHLGAILSSR